MDGKQNQAQPSQRETQNVLDVLHAPVELAVITDAEMAAMLELPDCCPLCGRKIEGKA